MFIGIGQPAESTNTAPAEGTPPQTEKSAAPPPGPSEPQGTPAQ